MKVIAVQRGARHRYAIPRMLNGAGCLECLYTDSNASQGMGRWVPGSWLPGRLRKLSDRVVGGVPAARMRTVDQVTLLDPYFRWSSANDFEFNARSDHVFSRELNRWGVRHADTVYSMMGEGWDFLVRAKEQGVRLILDVFITPIAHRIVEAERRSYPEWEAQESVPVETLEKELDRRFQLADILLCPSQTVIDGLSTYPSFDARKVRLVPYGHALDVSSSVDCPVSSQVLFGGTAELRKGIHYYCKAADILDRSGARFDFIVAGAVTNMVCQRPEAKRVRFLGSLRRAAFLVALRSSSVFVLPSLAEGSASVIFEALCCGVPVVTTRSAGSVVTDGKEGWLVRERDSEALAGAIRSIVMNPRLRAGMSREALRTAAEHTENHWCARLIEALH